MCTTSIKNNNNKTNETHETPLGALTGDDRMETWLEERLSSWTGKLYLFIISQMQFQMGF